MLGRKGKWFVYNMVFFCFPFHRAKKDLDENMTVAQTWSEFNAMLDKNKVCAETNFSLSVLEQK